MNENRNTVTSWQICSAGRGSRVMASLCNGAETLSVPPQDSKGRTWLLFLVTSYLEITSCRVFVPSVTRHRLHPSAFQKKSLQQVTAFERISPCWCHRGHWYISESFVTTLLASQMSAPPSEYAPFILPNKQKVKEDVRVSFCLFYCFFYSPKTVNHNSTILQPHKQINYLSQEALFKSLICLSLHFLPPHCFQWI